MIPENFFMSPTIGALMAALAKAQGSLKAATKDSVNPHFKSRYADLASVTEASREALEANHLAVVQLPIGRAPEIGLKTILGHSSGEYLGGDFYVTAAQNTAQAAGACITYLRRYGRAAVLGISQDDDDGNGASQVPPAPRYDPQNRAHQDRMVLLLKERGIPESEWDKIGNAMRGKQSAMLDEVIEGVMR